MLRRSFLLGALCVGSLQAQGAPVPEAAPLAEPSLISLPIRVDLTPVFQAAERNAPKVPPGTETWIPLPGISKGSPAYRFNLYRDPLLVSLKGNHIKVRTTTHYWMEVGMRMGTWIKGVGSCGQGPEGHRQVVLGVQAEVGVTPAWGLDLKASPEDPLPISPCEVTFLGYDITDKVVAGMRDALLKATQAMEQQVRDSVLLRQRAEAVWAQAQEPITLAEGVHLLLNPERVRLAPFTSAGRVLTLLPEIQAHPTLTLGPRPTATPRPLPGLEAAPANLHPGFHIRVEADLSYEHASAQLNHQMAGRKFETDKGTFEVVSAGVRGRDGKAILDLQLKGKVTGKLTLIGRPAFDAATGALHLEDLDYSLEAKGWITKVGEWILRSNLRRLLAEKANFFMDRSLGDLRTTVQAGLNRNLTPGLNLSGTLSGMSLEQPRVLEDRFRVDAVLDGQVQLEFKGSFS